MNTKIWIRKALSMCLVAVTIAAYSMVTLATTEKIAGELLVNGRAHGGQSASVKINDETAQSGRSIFSGSTIVTPDAASAVISLGKAGKIELAPNSVASLSFNEKTVTGNLTAGRLTVLNASESVVVTTANGKTVTLNAGDSADAAAQTQTKDDDDNGFFGGHGALIAALIIGGAAAAIIYTARNGNDITLGGGSTVVSVTR